MFKSKELNDLITVGGERSGISTGNLMFIRKDLFEIHKESNISEDSILEAINNGMNFKYGIYKFCVQHICCWIREGGQNV